MIVPLQCWWQVYAMAVLAATFSASGCSRGPTESTGRVSQSETEPSTPRSAAAPKPTRPPGSAATPKSPQPPEPTATPEPLQPREPATPGSLQPREPTATPGSLQPREPTATPGLLQPLRASVHRGMCVAHNYQHDGSRGYGSTTSRRTLEELKALGVTWVSLTPFGFMRDTRSTTVRPIGNFKAGETDARMRTEITAAKSLGLRVVLKPHLWLYGGGWRGDIAHTTEAKRTQWFASYAKWMRHYAALAAETGVDLLVVGVELDQTAKTLDGPWRTLIQQIRGVFKGPLTYSANWDRVRQIPWWDALDFVGVQFYPPMATGNDDSVTDMGRTIDQRLDRLCQYANSLEKPILLTEVGVRSADGAARKPYEWPSSNSATQVDADNEEQARATFALLQAVAKRPEIAGIYWWKWFTDPDTKEEGPDGFSPRGKPAEALLRAAFKNGL